jgi:hypothetical protein
LAIKGETSQDQKIKRKKMAFLTLAPGIRIKDPRSLIFSKEQKTRKKAMNLTELTENTENTEKTRRNVIEKIL